MFRGPTVVAVALAALALTSAAASLILEGPPPAPRITVRWLRELPADERATYEQALRLSAPEWREGTVWTYSLESTATEDVRRVVDHPEVADTHGLDRETYRLPSQPGRDWTRVFRRAVLLFLYAALGLAVALTAVVGVYRTVRDALVLFNRDR